MFERIGCFFGNHVRSRGKAHQTPTRTFSECKRCGTPMEKVGERWQVRSDVDEV